jgi:molybdopterin synthase catalytic subunit
MKVIPDSPDIPDNMDVRVELTASPIDPGEVLAGVIRPAAGGTALFAGTTRRQDGGRRIRHLEYEAYDDMAIAMMRELAAEIGQRWKPLALAIVHRTGRVAPGEPSVVIAVATPHRAEAFEACRHAIDWLKKNVPIWKKEVYEGGEGGEAGEAWVGGAEKIEPDAFTRRAIP